MRSVEAISHKLDGLAAAMRPERDARRLQVVAQAVTDDGRVRAERLEGFIEPERLPGVGIEFVGEAVATLDFPSIAAQTCGDLAITVDGAQATDRVILGPPALAANLSATGFVSATDTVTVRLCNPTIGAIDPASATWAVTVVR